MEETNCVSKRTEKPFILDVFYVQISAYLSDKSIIQEIYVVMLPLY